MPEWAAALNEATKTGLLLAVSRVYTSNNLCIIPQGLSSLLNFLTPFLELKTAGRFDKTVWLETLAASDVELFVDEYDGLIFIVDPESPEQFLSLLPKLEPLSKKITLVVKDLTRTFYYELAKVVRGSADEFGAAAKVDVAQPVIRLSPYCRVSTWQTNPILLEDFVFSINMPQGGLWLYFENPLVQVSQLADAVVKILDFSTDHELLKFKNAFSNGDHASLLLNTVLNDKLPLYLASTLTSSERYWYENQLSGNTDFVVLERNADYFPLLLDHLNYLGLLDDVFGTKDEFSNVLASGEKLNDELYSSIRDLNFGSIGVKLNKLARYIQLQYEHSDRLQDLKEIKELVKLLGNLTSKQELVRKHTALSERVLGIIRNDTSSGTKHDLRERWLALQNDVFDLDYKQQLAKLHALLAQKATLSIVTNYILLVSIINDGLKPKDLEAVEREVHSCYGLEGTYVLQKAKRLHMLKTNNKSTDFFGAFTFGGKTEIETTTTSTASPSKNKKSPDTDISYDNIDLLGVTAGQDVYKSTYTLISKFWNLHPLDEEAEEEPVIESVDDYPHPLFAFPAATVPLTSRLIEALYFRDFLKYKPVNKTTPRPNWDLLNLDTMIEGRTVDRNICDPVTSFLSAATMDLRPQYVFVVLVGGITRGEISVLRHLQGKLRRQNKHLFVLTSGLVSNRRLMEVLQT